jgi:hypothetical protein
MLQLPRELPRVMSFGSTLLLEADKHRIHTGLNPRSLCHLSLALQLLLLLLMCQHLLLLLRTVLLFQQVLLLVMLLLHRKLLHPQRMSLLFMLLLQQLGLLLVLQPLLFLLLLMLVLLLTQLHPQIMLFGSFCSSNGVLPTPCCGGVLLGNSGSILCTSQAATQVFNQLTGHSQQR